MYGQYASKNQINLQPLDLDEMITDSVSSKQTPFRSKLKRLKNSTEWLRARDQSSSSSSIGDETSKTLAFTPIDQNETMPPLPIIETCRKRKRRPSVYSLQRLGEEEFPISRSGSFRDNVRVFLREFAEVEEYNVRGSPVWCTLLNHEAKSSVIPLYVIEEDVVRSSEPYCDHCRCTGSSASV